MQRLLLGINVSNVIFYSVLCSICIKDVDDVGDNVSVFSSKGKSACDSYVWKD